jgi:DNA-binding CsgD family transcriptional regulator
MQWRDMEKAIYVLGPMKLQNSLMASHFQQVMGIKCEAVKDASHLPGRERAVGGEKRLILLDCNGSSLKICLEALSTNGSRSLGRDLLALFNLLRGGGSEEENLAYGVRGFFYEEDTIEQVVKGVQAIFDGELWLPRKIMSRVILNNYLYSSPAKERQVELLLTPREKEILTLIAQGASNDMIADKLCISYHTVKSHLYNLFRKIGVPNRLQAAFWAVKNL